MRILVVGAGAVGGYFGGRLLAAQRDVTFLVRPRRAAELATGGLRIRSPHGNLHLPLPPTVLAEDLHDTFDLVLLSCKAFDLTSAIAAFAPAVGRDTVILPLLNGMRHIDVLADRFGPCVLGGRCLISSTLDEHRDIVHLSEIHSLFFGELDGAATDRVRSIAKLLEGAGFDSQSSPKITLEMWEKWVFIATLAGSTCLMRAAIGHISSAPGGKDFILGLLEECRAIAAAEGFEPRPPSVQRARDMFTAPDSPLTASMLRDLQAGGPIEGDQIIGDLLTRAQRAGIHPTLLPVIYTSLKTYEAQRRSATSLLAGGGMVPGGLPSRRN